MTRVTGNTRHPLRNGLIAAVVLLVLAAAGGVAYTYFASGLPPSQSAANVTAPNEPSLKAVKPAANAPASASMQILTPAVAPGDNAAVNIQTVAGSNCKITVIYGTLAARDSGLTAKDADQFGVVNWTWTVDKSAPDGAWPVDVTCVYNGRSAVVSGKLLIAAPRQP